MMRLQESGNRNCMLIQTNIHLWGKFILYIDFRWKNQKRPMKSWIKSNRVLFFHLTNIFYWAPFMCQALFWVLRIQKWTNQTMLLLSWWKEKDRKQVSRFIDGKAISDSDKCHEDNSDGYSDRGCGRKATRESCSEEVSFVAQRIKKYIRIRIYVAEAQVDFRLNLY